MEGSHRSKVFARGWVAGIASSAYATTALDRRADTSTATKMASIIEAIFLVGRIVLPPPATQEWDRQVSFIFRSLSYADFSDWLNRSPEGQEARASMTSRTLSQYIACNLQLFNEKVARWLGSRTFTCLCYGDSCCGPNDSCPNPNSKRRLMRSLRLRPRQDGTYSWTASRNGQTYSGTYLGVHVRRPA